MAFDRSVIQHPTGTTTAAVAMAALALSAVVALAGREPAPAAPRPELAARAAAARAALAMKYARAMLTRALAKAEPCLGEQFALWERAGLAFDEIAAQRDVDAATRKRAARAAVECWKHLDDGCWFAASQAPDDQPSREELPYGPMPPVRQAAPCSHHGVEYFYAMDLREAAEAQPLPRAQSELWKQAALAFDEIAAQPDLCAATRKRAAHSAIECWKHLISDCRRWDAQVPDHRSTRPALPYAPRKLVAAIEVYRGDASVDSDDDYLEMTLREASIYERYDHLEEALRLYRDVVDHHRDRDAETAQFAGNLARDCERRLGFR